MIKSNPPPNLEGEHNAGSDQRILRLEEEIQRLQSDLKELEVLNELAIALGSSRNIDQMLDIVVDKSVQALRAEQGAIKLLTEEEDAPLKTLIQVDRRSRVIDYRVGLHIIGWVLKNRQPLLIENLAGDARFHASAQEAAEIKSLLCVPIFSRTEMLGILMVTNKKGSEPFNRRDQRFLSIIAAQSGELIRNRRLQAEALEKKRIEQELALARKIQMSLIPKEVPQAEKLQIIGYIQTADMVGGDYFDYFNLGDGQIGVAIADVSGHGPSAALIMTMVKGILHSLAQKFESAGRALRELNAVLYNIVPPEIFVSMLFLVFDAPKGILRFASAGHPPLLHYHRQSASCQAERIFSPALCLSPDSEYSEREIPLAPGDLFFIYTDGVTEVSDASGNMLAEEGLLRAVRATAAQTPGEIIEHLKNTIRLFAGNTPQNDDLAMIAIKVG